MLSRKRFTVVHILGLLLSVRLGLLLDLLPIAEKSDTLVKKSDTIAKKLDNIESKLDIILEKMKDHVDSLDSMAQLEVIPPPAKTEEEFEENLAAFKVCGYNTSVK